MCWNCRARYTTTARAPRKRTSRSATRSTSRACARTGCCAASARARRSHPCAVAACWPSFWWISFAGVRPPSRPLEAVDGEAAEQVRQETDRLTAVQHLPFEDAHATAGAEALEVGDGAQVDVGRVVPF